MMFGRLPGLCPGCLQPLVLSFEFGDVPREADPTPCPWGCAAISIGKMADRLAGGPGRAWNLRVSRGDPTR